MRNCGDVWSLVSRSSIFVHGCSFKQIVYRTEEEKLKSLERLNLDRRQLTHCPVLYNEQRLRLLNYQHNAITAIRNVDNLPNLIFLDVYNNKISSLEGSQLRT